ncbi:hypothetical protein KIK84_15120 [Curvibacter sp. CHRR-16]|uniref:hypothetical protein n=1 Tax=Curvibacter sp. CHRR-16 TaxID=2835872 RepID=UPI001BDAF9CE|nr:hypothetical protein [Curvibacter sp. CHRR-16]MBT0571656.1 hypothetical protein [Curvibacter sp. CHRR-16]
MNWSRFTLLGVVAAVLTACGGGGDSSSSSNVLTGTFVDAKVQGLSYTCGTQSGQTNASGNFSYVAGSTCTFKVGGVTLGSSTAKAVVTPVSLVSGASDETNSTVQNIVRFLMTLDTDGDASNGIGLGTSGTTLSSDTLDFSSASFDTDAQTLVSKVNSSSTLVTATDAASHLQSSLKALMNGTYSCTYSGTDNGTVSMTVSNGSVSGSGSSSKFSNFTFTVSGTLSSTGTASITGSGAASSGATFSGSFTQVGSASGTWTNTISSTTYSGSWSCSRTSS